MTEVKQGETYYSERIKRAAHILFFKHGRIPGSKAWELKTGLGKDYVRILSQLDEQLKDLDLEVKKVESNPLSDYKPIGEMEDESRYFVRLKGTLTPREARMTGWRLDNLASLAAALSFVVSKQGKSERKEIEETIGHKAGRWRALTLMDAFLRAGYLEEDEEGLIKLGWRTRAEIDLQSLMLLIAESKPAAKQAEDTAENLEESISTDAQLSPNSASQDSSPNGQPAASP